MFFLKHGVDMTGSEFSQLSNLASPTVYQHITSKTTKQSSFTWSDITILSSHQTTPNVEDT